MLAPCLFDRWRCEPVGLTLLLFAAMCECLVERAFARRCASVLTDTTMDAPRTQVRDLLSPLTLKTALDLREDPDKGVYVAGLSTHDARSTAGMLELMANGTAARATGATAMNASSSRSHSIFTVRRA
jgi:hypothetical protein